ncbi:DUF7668 domain-containing protein [Variovorax paradoxus]|jgi:hypothetical protein
MFGTNRNQTEANEKFRIHAHKLLGEFVRAIDKCDQQELKGQFDVSEALAEEILEIIREYHPREKFSLGIAPLESAFSTEKSTRPNIELFEMNDRNKWGAECVLWVNGNPSEPILHVEFFEQASDLKLQYKYIGS